MGISDNVQLALIVAIPPLIAVPLTAWVSSKSQRKLKEAESQENERLKRLEAELRRTEKNEDAERARRERAEDQAAARELLKNTAATAQAAVSTAVKLEEVRGHVNSFYTASLEVTYTALQTTLIVQLDSLEFKKSRGVEPTPQALAAIEITRTKMSELRSVIDERLRNDKAAAEAAAKLKSEMPEIKLPVPVADDRTAMATERAAAASERVASAAERSATSVEKKAADEIAPPAKDK